MTKHEPRDILTMDQLRHADLWVRDSERSHCAVCVRAFQFLRRKHHCRQCGEIICHSCLLPRPANLPVIGLCKVKVCMTCILQPPPERLVAQCLGNTPKTIEPRPMARSDACIGGAQSSPVRDFAPSSLPAAKGLVEDAARPECAICWSAERDAVCVPCGHMAGCKSCLSRLAGASSPCPICRSSIERVIKVYDC
ncbi:hypothetical protein PINS_up006222 [Pythium insidiosum]|nr:hypothetical protein PINS_up006222 [Pythium insidiosum]